jgi:hypothetical protein
MAAQLPGRSHRVRNGCLIAFGSAVALIVALAVIGAIAGKPPAHGHAAPAVTKATARTAAARKPAPSQGITTPPPSARPATATARPSATATRRAGFTARIVKPKPYADPTFPDTLDVFFTVTNNGTAAASPECIVSADSPGALHTGTDVLEDVGRIGPGKTIPVTAEVKITGPARFVTTVLISCDKPAF